MPLDPNIFFRGAEMQQRNNAQTQATIGNFFDKLAATKERKLAEEKALESDYEGSMMRVLQAQAAGKEPDPKDFLRAKALDRYNQSQNAINPTTGQPFPKNSSIFGNLQSAGGAQYPAGGFSAPPSMPVDAISIVPQPVGRGALPTGGNMPYVDDIGLGNVNDMVPPIGDNYAEVSGGVDRNAARGLPAPANERQGLANYEAQLDIAKTVMGEEAKVNAAAAADERKLTKMQDDTLPILLDMIEINKGTLDTPYAGSALVQGAAKLSEKLPDKFDVSKEAGQMDLLKQSRLDLAAPLAKQLGVNPTDKDFQASLERIVDVNATKSSREAQIRQLIKKIERRKELKAKGFETPQDIVEKRGGQSEYQTTLSGIKYKVVQ